MMTSRRTPLLSFAKFIFCCLLVLLIVVPLLFPFVPAAGTNQPPFVVEERTSRSTSLDESNSPKVVEPSTREYVTQLESHSVTIEDGVASIRTELRFLAKTLGEKIDGLGARMDGLEGKMDDLKSLVERTNPTAFLEQLNPPLVNTDEELTDAISRSTTCTWTYMKRGPTFYAVTAKHCMFSFVIDKPAVTFATLPQATLEAGVAKVGFVPSPEKYSSKGFIGTDFAIVELKNTPNLTDSALNRIPDYPLVDLSKHSSARARTGIALGRGASANVIGKGIALVKTARNLPEHFTTVEEFAEPGHSGTLMFSSTSCGALKGGKPFAVFSRVA